MFVPSKELTDNMLFQTKTFQRTNIFQWISMNVGTFPIAPTAISNFQSTHIFYWVITPIIDKKFFAMKKKEGKLLKDKWWQIFSILWVPWINGVLSRPLPIPREIYLHQNMVDLTLFGTLQQNGKSFSCKIFGLQT